MSGLEGREGHQAVQPSSMECHRQGPQLCECCQVAADGSRRGHWSKVQFSQNCERLKGGQ